MKLFVKDIVEGGADLEFEYGEELFRGHSVVPEESGFLVEGPIRGSIRAHRSGWEVFLEGSVSGRVELQCGRCLEKFPFDFSRQFHLDLLPEIDRRERGGDVQLREEELELGFYQGDFIALEPIILEQVFLSIPANPRCKPECRGLCPVCGRNRNKEECDCKQAEVSAHPFAALKKFKISRGGG